MQSEILNRMVLCHSIKGSNNSLKENDKQRINYNLVALHIQTLSAFEYGCKPFPYQQTLKLAPSASGFDQLEKWHHFQPGHVANFTCPERKRIPENTHFLHVVLDQQDLQFFSMERFPSPCQARLLFRALFLSNSCTPYAANGNQSSQRTSTKVVHARQDIVAQICPTFKHMWGEYSKTLASIESHLIIQT